MSGAVTLVKNAINQADSFSTMEHSTEASLAGGYPFSPQELRSMVETAEMLIPLMGAVDTETAVAYLNKLDNVLLETDKVKNRWWVKKADADFFPAREALREMTSNLRQAVADSALAQARAAAKAISPETSSLQLQEPKAK